ncbi:hypothetical protein K432DRAFT_413769 [Lepidopterella palustris CBS 459.81]|uniref:PINIT domain-containing protein n=1 Tax=Lepidopterella palustris CBS 459.81 TaxID=1314670 RepID=A0A8E2JJY9_9PEZI|nr:hypothetical protein K432DRAFT_413769 [Lepidopterella palustris CBS 459.81]
MATSGRALQEQAHALQARIKTLINSDLKEICRGENLQVSGVKAALQNRIISLIDTFVRSGDVQGIARIRHRIANHGVAAPPGVYTSAGPAYNSSASPNAPGPYDMPNGYGRPPAVPAPARSTYPNRFLFRESPFFEIKDTLANPITLEVTPNHRTSTTGHLTLNQINADLVKNDSNLRIMIFSAMEQPLSPFSRNDIAFPGQVEVRVNGDEVKGNYKGLKNKPGSTRPADITEYVRKIPNYKNTIAVTYALTQKAMVVHLVKKHSVEELTESIKRGKIISKQTVISEMLKKADDPDIVFNSTVMSLKDPVSTLRIATPCRSSVCNHNQCFDAASFLQLQEQAPTWTCPVCNKIVSFEALAVDQYVQEILDSVPRSTESVTIEPNGKWSQSSSSENQAPRNGATSSYDEDGDEDDLVEISDYRVTNIKNEASNTPFSLARTPPLSSREASTAAPAPRSSHKRTSEVIDLTLSDDDEPPRPAKKVAYNTPNSLPDPSRNGYRLPSLSNNAHSRPQNGVTPFRLAPPSQQQQHQQQQQYGAYPPRPPPAPSSYPNQGTYGSYSAS